MPPPKEAHGYGSKPPQEVQQGPQPLHVTQEVAPPPAQVEYAGQPMIIRGNGYYVNPQVTNDDT